MQSLIIFFHIGKIDSKSDYIQYLLEQKINICILDDVGISPKSKLMLPYFFVSQNESNILRTITTYLTSKSTTINQSFFFTIEDGSVNLCNRLLKALGKPPISHLDGNLRDKYRVRRLLEDAGVEKLPYVALATHPGEIPTPPPGAFPLIVKPVDSAGSYNIFLARNHDELRKACLYIFTNNRTIINTDHGEVVKEDVYGQSPHALIETKLSGEKLSAEVIVHQGQVRFIAFPTGFDHDNGFFIERAIILNPHAFTQDEKDKLTHYVQRLIDALQVESSLLHIDLFYDREADAIRLIEVNFRLGGSRIPELVQRVYGIDLVEEYLALVMGTSEGERLAKAKAHPAELTWILFGFLTQETGILEIKQSTAFGEPIQWHYPNNSRVARTPTVKFNILGSVVFSATVDEVADRLQHLQIEAHRYFALHESGSQLLSSPALDVKNSKKGALNLLRAGIVILYVLACFLGAFYLYRSFDAQSRVMGDIMAKTLAYHLSNGEIYYAANIFNNFEAGKLYDKIVVADQHNKVIYSASADKPYPYFYQEEINPAQFHTAIPIRMNGLDMGVLAYNANYRTLVGQLVVGFLLVSAILWGLYFIIARYLFGKLAASAKGEVESFVSIIEKLKDDLDRFHEKHTVFSFDHYIHLLSNHQSDTRLMGGLKESLFKLIGILKELRNDLSEKHRLADLLDESTKQLLQTTAQAEIGKVAAQVSHDIRKPFSQLQAVLDQFESYQQNPSALTQAREEVRRSIRNVEVMVNDIMDYSREVQVETKPVPVAGVLDFSIRQALHAYRGENNPPDIRFEYVFRHAHQALMDDERMARVFGNIVSNAVEAITIIGKQSQGRVWVHTQARSDDPQKPTLEICIGNDGPAFRSEDLPKLFSSFFTKGKKKGTGLGLASVAKIIRLHGGTISARNVPNDQGVEFVMTLPLSSEPDLLAPHALPQSLQDILTTEMAPSPHGDTAQWLNRLATKDHPFKVLLLEDETLYRAAVRNVLASSEALRKNVLLYDANTVDSALALLAQYPDIHHAIVDIDLGEMKNGFDFIREAKCHSPALHAMVHSNRCLDEDKALAKSLGASGFVSKPLDLDIFVRFLATDLAEETPDPSLETPPHPTVAPATPPCCSCEPSVPLDGPLLCYVADDSPILRMGFKMKLTTVLGAEQVDIRLFERPEALLEAVDHTAPHVVFCDYHFDGISAMTGLEALVDIRGRHPSMPLFLVSNIDTHEGETLVRTHCLSGFIRPNITKEALKPLLDKTVFGPKHP